MNQSESLFQLDFIKTYSYANTNLAKSLYNQKVTNGHAGPCCSLLMKYIHVLKFRKIDLTLKCVCSELNKKFAESTHAWCINVF